MLTEHVRPTVVGALASLPLVLHPALAPDPFATTVADYQPGAGGGVFVADNLLGGPRGGGLTTGSLHVASLGVGGSAVLGFDVVLRDGPGADLTVFENGFFDGAFAGVFSEVCFVEVSSNGTDYARFPSSYAGPVGPLSAFGSVAVGSYAGLAGGRPGIANVDTNAVDPLDPAVSGGYAFDLDDLADDPLVQAGTVDLERIRFVRLVDVVSGDPDSQGVAIWDNGGASGADMDAVAILNHTANVEPGRPAVELWIDDLGFLNLVVEDADGLDDVVDLDTTLSLVPIQFQLLLPSFTLVSSSATSIHLVLGAPVPGSGLLGDLTISVGDASGLRSSDHVTIQG